MEGIRGMIMNETNTQIIPDWSQAPRWARYWTRDAGGAAVWWEAQPVLKQRKGAWLCGEGQRERADDFPVLHQRPQRRNDGDDMVSS